MQGLLLLVVEAWIHVILNHTQILTIRVLICKRLLQLTVRLTEPSVVTHQSLDVILTHRVEAIFGALKQVVALFI